MLPSEQENKIHIILQLWLPLNQNSATDLKSTQNKWINIISTIKFIIYSNNLLSHVIKASVT